MERFQKLQAALKSGEQKVLTWPPHEAGDSGSRIIGVSMFMHIISMMYHIYIYIYTHINYYLDKDVIYPAASWVGQHGKHMVSLSHDP